jgi:hypothetical protein
LTGNVELGSHRLDAAVMALRATVDYTSPRSFHLKHQYSYDVLAVKYWMYGNTIT